MERQSLTFRYMYIWSAMFCNSGASAIQRIQIHGWTMASSPRVSMYLQ
jgi:hypothetical protein